MLYFLSLLIAERWCSVYLADDREQGKHTDTKCLALFYSKMHCQYFSAPDYGLWALGAPFQRHIMNKKTRCSAGSSFCIVFPSVHNNWCQENGYCNGASSNVAISRPNALVTLRVTPLKLSSSINLKSAACISSILKRRGSSFCFINLQ